MATNVIMPALELAQETGKLLRWIKAPGETVRKGEPIAEIETDKVTIELEAPASGVLSAVTAQEGDVIPVGHTIAQIAAANEAPAPTPTLSPEGRGQGEGPDARVKASPLARKIAGEHGVDLARVKTASGKIEKADVLAFVESQRVVAAPTNGSAGRLVAASPKARRLAAERGIDLRALKGSGPGGAVLTLDVPAATSPLTTSPLTTEPLTLPSPQRGEGVGTVWRIMAERMTASWTSAPHFYLVREVNVTRLVAWLPKARKQTGAHVTYTDLLVKLVAATLAQHPRVNVSWKDGTLERHADINIGLAVALEDGLVVPVLHKADTLGLKEIATRREDRGRVQRHRQPAAGRDPGGGPHHRSRRPGQRPAGRAADHGAHAILRPSRPRRRPWRPVPRGARGSRRGAAGPARLRTIHPWPSPTATA